MSVTVEAADADAALADDEVDSFQVEVNRRIVDAVDADQRGLESPPVELHGMVRQPRFDLR